MIVNNIKIKLRNAVKNSFGWSTDRKIVVIESDDWGSIRMPSREVFDKLKSAGIDLTRGDSARYNLYDTLATKDDLEALFNVLSAFKDKERNSAKFTVVSLAANPDFEKIESNGFKEYYYEPFTETLKKYPGCEESYKYWKAGIEENIFLPQFHGREHLNVHHWITALRNNDYETRTAFDCRMWGFNRKASASSIPYQAAFDLSEITELEYQKKVIEEGLDLFENIHGYKAEFFVPPNGPFNNSLFPASVAKGIKFVSTSKIQLEPVGKGKTRKVFHWLGQRNKHGQIFLTRNCFFEPSQPGKDWVNSCLSEIESAFKWKKPAVISSHRVNYIGALDIKNRENGLRELERLLKSILSKWPDAEFMFSNELGRLINSHSE